MRMIQELLGYFLIGIIGMLVLAILYLPIYFILRKKIAFMRQLAYFLLIVCFLVICDATFLMDIGLNLIAGSPILAADHHLNLIPFQFITTSWRMEARKQITQEIANVLMFLPMGFIFPVAFKKMRGFWKTTACMMLFSFFIEFVQYFIGRSADIDDLILNTLGGALGYLVFYIFSKCFKNKNFWQKLNDTKER